MQEGISISRFERLRKQTITNWHISIPLLFAFLFTEDLTHLYTIVKYGGYSIDGAFFKILRDFSPITILGYLFSTCFRLIPYALLSFILFILGRRINRLLLLPTIFGGIAGILTYFIPQTIAVWKPLYTPGAHVSSTMGLAFIFIPAYSLPYMFTGLVGGLGITFTLGVLYAFTVKFNFINRAEKVLYCIAALACAFSFQYLRTILIQDEDTQVTRNILLKEAKDTINKDRLNQLYQQANSSNDFELLGELAGNILITENMIKEMYAKCLPIPTSTDRCYSVFSYLAMNSKTPLDILEQLGKRSESMVRARAALNGNTPLELVEKLSSDSDWQVRISVTGNPKVTKSILTKLKSDPNKVVRSYAETSWKYRGFSN